MIIDLFTLSAMITAASPEHTFERLPVDTFYCKISISNLPGIRVGGDVREAAAEADERVHVFIMKNRRLPKGFKPNEFSELKIDRERWIGGSKFRTPEQRHRVFHPNALDAWRRQLELLEEVRPFKGFDTKDKIRLRRIINGEIFKYLSRDEQRAIADKSVVEAWINEGTVFGRDSEIWSELGFSHSRWVGSGRFREDEIRFHDSLYDALQAALRVVEARPDFIRPEIVNVRRQLQKQIFIESDLTQKKRIAFERVIDFIRKHHRTPVQSSDLSQCEFDQMGVVYSSIVGPQGHSLYKDASAFYEEVLKTISAEDEFVADLIGARLLEAKRWAFRKLKPVDQRVVVDRAVADWILQNLRIPRYDEISKISYPPISVEKWIGVRKFLYKFGPHWKRALHRHAYWAWLSVANLIEAAPVDDRFTAEIKTALTKQIKFKARLSRMTRTEKRDWIDRRVAKYILKYGWIPPSEGSTDFEPRTFAQIFGQNFRIWAGTKDYSRAGSAATHSHQALHTDPVEAFSAVRDILKDLPLPDGVTETMRIERLVLIEARIRLSRRALGN